MPEPDFEITSSTMFVHVSDGPHDEMGRAARDRMQAENEAAINAARESVPPDFVTLPAQPPDDDTAVVIAEGYNMELEDAVREILEAADDMLTPALRPVNAHGGAYLSRWHFERLRAAYRRRVYGRTE